LERLSNRLGERHVRGLRCLADHRPERAWRLCAPDESGEMPPSSPHAVSQPPWLLAQPRPLQVRDDIPQYGGALRLEDLPQRIEAGWWDGFDITRDYFIAHSRAGERLWVFRDRRAGGWYLHGLFV
jgi:protein ImuB